MSDSVDADNLPQIRQRASVFFVFRVFFQQPGLILNPRLKIVDFLLDSVAKVDRETPMLMRDVYYVPRVILPFGVISATEFFVTLVFEELFKLSVAGDFDFAIFHGPIL